MSPTDERAVPRATADAIYEAVELALIRGEWFTREDVELCRDQAIVAMGQHDIADEYDGHYYASEKWRKLADRIEALLPPARPTPGEPQGALPGEGERHG